MKKAIFAVFVSLLSAALLVCVLGGCDHELLLHGTGMPTTIPSLTTIPDIDPPETVPGTLPTTGTLPPGTTDPYPITLPTIPEDAYLNYSLCTVDADERAAAQNWICLNNYVQLAAWEWSYHLFFDTAGTQPDNWVNLTTLSFRRPVRVCGVELTFVNGTLSLSDVIRYDVTTLDPYAVAKACADVELYSDNLLLPGNTLWLEPATDEEGRGFGDFWNEATTLRAYLHSDSLVRVRFFGTTIPTVDEVRIPSYQPVGMDITNNSDLPKYCMLCYYNRDGEEIAHFKQAPIYGKLQLPAGTVEMVQFAGRNMVRVSYAWDPDVYDLYWDDGEYRYQLWGYDEELLLKLVESMK